MSVQGAIIYLVCRYAYVCVRVCDIEFVVFTDCESCTRPIATNPVSMEAGECGLPPGTWFFARRLEVVAVAGLLWLSRCVFGEAGFFSFSTTSTQPMAARDPDSGQRRLSEGAPTVSQFAHRELASTYLHQVYRLVCSLLRRIGVISCRSISKVAHIISPPSPPA